MSQRACFYADEIYKDLRMDGPTERFSFLRSSTRHPPFVNPFVPPPPSRSPSPVPGSFHEGTRGGKKRLLPRDRHKDLRRTVLKRIQVFTGVVS